MRFFADKYRMVRMSATNAIIQDALTHNISLQELPLRISLTVLLKAGTIVLADRLNTCPNLPKLMFFPLGPQRVFCSENSRKNITLISRLFLRYVGVRFGNTFSSYFLGSTESVAAISVPRVIILVPNQKPRIAANEAAVLSSQINFAS